MSFICSSAGDFVSVYVRCLDSSDQDVINSTLKNLAEFTLLAQGKHSHIENIFALNVLGPLND